MAVDSTAPQIIYSAGDDGLCKVWDRRCLSETNPTPVGILAGHKDGITFIDTKVLYIKLSCFNTIAFRQPHILQKTIISSKFYISIIYCMHISPEYNIHLGKPQS